MRGLNWTTRFVTLAGGRDGAADTRALEPPLLSRAVDVEFEERGGLQTRKPYVNLTTTGLGASVRRVYDNGGELIAFTKDQLLSYAPNGGGWQVRGTYLAAKVEETTRFATTDDQLDADRAELGNVIVYAWSDSTFNAIYVAAIDKTTGAVVLPPTSPSSGTQRPRLVALSSKILLLCATATPQLVAYAIDPANPGAALAGAATTVVPSPDFNLHYDVVKIPNADAAAFVARRSPNTSYEVGKITAALSITKTTKARTCSEACAVAVSPDSAKIQTLRGDGSVIRGDRLTLSTLADEATSQSVGTYSAFTVNQIAAAYRSVQDGGQYRCYVFWNSPGETTGNGDFATKSNYVDTGGGLGTEGILVRRVGVASRAFDHDGRVFVHLVFAGQSLFTGANSPLFSASLQNTYFLYRDDGFLVAKVANDRAGGFSFSVGHLPGVAPTGGTSYAWCAGERRVIELGEKQFGYAARAPLDVTVTLDSNEARRGVRLGQTFYVAGGEVMQYDGVGLYEVGFHVFPWTFGVVEGVSAGSVDPGDHAVKQTWRWDNATGELDRSTTATVGTVSISSGTRRIEWPDLKPLYTTHKTNRPIAVECWATAANPTFDAPFYLCTSKDPSATVNPNRYIANDTSVAALPQLNHELSDATLTTKESSDEIGDVLEHLAPPAASIIVASDKRLFLAGVAGDPDRVWYSRLRESERVASFNDALVVDVPAPGGKLTGLALHDETIAAFRESAIYLLPGDGFGNDGSGANYGPARIVATDVGAVSQESIGSMPLGTVFKSRKGWYLLDRGFSLQYIGEPVADYDGEDPLAVHVVETQHQVRILTANRMLVWDYRANQWAEWTVASKVHAAMWNGVHVVASGSAVSTQAADFSLGATYGMDVETAWLSTTDDKQGRGVVRALELLGEMGDGCLIRVRCAKDYREGDSTSPQKPYDYFHDRVIDPNTGELGGNPGDPLGLKVTPRRQSPCSAIKVRVSVMDIASAAATLATNVGGNWIANGTIATSGTAWNATLAARDPGDNGNQMSIGLWTTAGPGDVEVRDGEIFDGTSWVTAHDDRFVGVRVGDGATVGALELAINDGSRLIRVQAADPSPSKVITDTNLTHLSAKFTGGVTVPCSNDGIKLTGLSLEVGFKTGLNKRVPARQQS